MVEGPDCFPVIPHQRIQNHQPRTEEQMQLQVARIGKPHGMRGAKLFIETEDIGAEDDDEGWYEHELVGLEVRVGGNVVGKVSALHTLPVQDLLVVTTDDGKEVLIPFVEQIVPEVNVAEKYVLVTPPAGLFEVNTDAGETPDDGDGDGDDDKNAAPGAADRA